MTSRVPFESLESFVRRRRDCPTKACRSLAASGAPDFRGLRRSDLKYSAWSQLVNRQGHVSLPGQGACKSSSMLLEIRYRLRVSLLLLVMCRYCLPGELTMGVPVATHLLSACNAAKACIAVLQLNSH